MSELEIRLHEQIRIYDDSPGVTATYCDLKRIIEDMLLIIKTNNNIGFNGREEK